MQDFFNIGQPITSPDVGLKPAEFKRPMTCEVGLVAGDLVEVATGTIDSTTGCWTTVRGLVPGAGTTPEAKIYGVLLEDTALGEVGSVGFVGDFPVKCASGFNSAAIGLAVVANITNNASSGGASTTGNYISSNWAITYGTINTGTSSGSNAYVWRAAVGHVLSTNSVSNTAGYTQLVRFNGWGIPSHLK